MIKKKKKKNWSKVRGLGDDEKDPSLVSYDTCKIRNSD